jgi:hypothetical protein
MTLTLTDEMYATLTRFSKASGIPATKFVLEILGRTKDDLDRLSAVAEKAAGAPGATAAGVLMASLESMSKQISEMKTEVEKKA